ncbi:MAG: type VI secretion system tip protein VgrG [Xanthomonadales bacterium]|nr:type VI secretion system tip protein VgrG [Xanthomonadales bacterium]
MLPTLDPGNTRSAHLTTMSVIADGVELGAQYRIVSIEISREANRIPKASIVLLDGDPAAQTFSTSEEDNLIPGVDVEIRGGYASEVSSLFNGIVTRHRIEVGDAGATRLVIELRDPVFRMTQARHSRNFSEVKSSDIMEQLIAAYPNLTAEVSTTTFTHPQVVQQQISDWDFLVLQAEANGYDVITIDGTVKIASPVTMGTAATTATFGQNLLSADLELNAENQLASVETGAWDSANQELTLSDTSDAATAGPGNITGASIAGDAKTQLRHHGKLDQSSLDQWAATEMGRDRRSAIRGRVKVQGTEALIPGVLIELGGLGSRFNGLGYVSGIRHRLGRGNWRSEAIIGSDPRAHGEKHLLNAGLAAGASSMVSGLQIGIVIALENDPQGEDRIQIKYTTISETDGEVWARQALLDAGDGRGTTFRPEIGDEVIVGLLNSDPNDPVILGAVHSSAKPTPIEGSNDNHEKAIVTRSGMRLHFDDDKIIATIDTPSGNSIVLSEDESSIVIADQNDNKLTLNDSGIALESLKDITVSSSGGDVKIEGINVEISASASVKMDGSGTAELTSSGSTTVKGSIVQIN